MLGLSLVAASGGHSSSRCAGLSPSRPLLLQTTGSRRAGSVIVAHGPSCSAACGILPDQGSNPCPLHWQADSQPLRHQGSPILLFWCSISSTSQQKGKFLSTWLVVKGWIVLERHWLPLWIPMSSERRMGNGLINSYNHIVRNIWGLEYHILEDVRCSSPNTYSQLFLCG